MSGIGKATATRWFQELEIESLPAKVYEPGVRPDASRLEVDLGGDVPLMIRTAAVGEERNLPRVVGLTAKSAADWIGELDPHLAVIVQPYDDVVFSVEAAVQPSGVVAAEVVPGVWELDATAVPARVEMTHGSEPVVWKPEGPQPARFYSLADGYTIRPALVLDWQIALTGRWLESARSALATIGERVGGPYALKLHYASRWGLSPQNVRAGAVAALDTEPVPGGAVVLGSVVDHIPAGTRAVVVRFAVAREDAPTVVAFAAQVAAAGVTDAWVYGGLLSHLAICLREAGLSVHQVREAS